MSHIHIHTHTKTTPTRLLYQEEGIFSRDQAREYIGRSFREKIRYAVPAWYTNQECCDWLLDRCVVINLDDPKEKFSTICIMIKKLFSYIQNKEHTNLKSEIVLTSSINCS